MTTTAELLADIRRCIQRDRMLDTARRLVAVPSHTGEAGAALDTLAQILKEDGLTVQREAAGHPTAAAVLARLESGLPGRCLQFNGHLDVVHLPYVPPSVEGNLLKGSGACDMKGGTAAAVEAFRALRDSGLLRQGSVLLCGHELHEAPWGLGEQLDTLIRAGVHGDAVLIPEPLTNHLPVAGRGAATWKVTLRRKGPPVHEVMRPADEPSVIAAGARLVGLIAGFEKQLSGEQNSDPVAGSESVFVGQIHSGEIYNQYPQECWLEGTRRWLPGRSAVACKDEFLNLVRWVHRDGVTTDVEWRHIRGAFRLDVNHPVVAAFRAGYTAMTGKPLESGPKMFVDDGNSFWGLAKVPAITHGPRAGGQHTVNEWIDIDDMVRVATLYALTAALYLNAENPATDERR
jgi:succinyl-diaminopimelate desuccinylase